MKVLCVSYLILYEKNKNEILLSMILCQIVLMCEEISENTKCFFVYFRKNFMEEEKYVYL